MRRHKLSKQNEYEIDGDVTTLKTNGGDVLIDTEDLVKILPFNVWRVTKRGDVCSQSSVRINGKDVITTTKLHRLVMDAPKGKVVDHINHNRLDNRKSNLRICTFAENGKNLSLKKNNTSGVAGVCWDKSRKKWSAVIKVNYKPIHLGRYKEFNDAVKVRKEAELKYFGEFAPRAIA